MEVWKDIKGYEGIYKVSSEGRVKSLWYGKEKILSPLKSKNGYLNIILHKNKTLKHYYIHRLVAAAFIPNHNNLPEINHKDHDKTNNSVSNLEFCDRQYNIDYSFSKKVLCIETGYIYNSVNEAERITGINCGNISRACNGKYKTAGGFHWKYAN